MSPIVKTVYFLCAENIAHGLDVISPCTVLDLWRIGGGGSGGKDVALQPSNQQPTFEFDPPNPRNIRNVNFILCYNIKVYTDSN